MGNPHPLEPDQEIRVLALEYASKLIDYGQLTTKESADMLVSNAGQIEKFIKEG